MHENGAVWQFWMSGIHRNLRQAGTSSDHHWAQHDAKGQKAAVWILRLLTKLMTWLMTWGRSRKSGHLISSEPIVTSQWCWTEGRATPTFWYICMFLSGKKTIWMIEWSCLSWLKTKRTKKTKNARETKNKYVEDEKTHRRQRKQETKTTKRLKTKKGM